jgi:hypothetical protein
MPTACPDHLVTDKNGKGKGKLADDAELFCKRRINHMALFLTQGHLYVTPGTPGHGCKADECSSKSSRGNDNVAGISSGSAP